MALGSLSRKYFPLLVLVPLALSAYFEAAGASQLLGALLISPTAGASRARPRLVPARAETRTAAAIIERNPFDSVTRPLDAGASETTSSVRQDTELVPKNPLQVGPCDGIQRINDTEFHIDHAIIDDILEHQAELMQSVRIVPGSAESNLVGLRLSGIRSGTLLAMLGIRDGDRVESINGFNLANPEKALEAYARLRTASTLSVKLTRQGRPVSIDYRIQ